MKTTVTKLSRTAVTVSGGVIFMASAALPAFAEQTAGKVESRFDEVVVTATRIAEPIKDVPASIRVITQEEIKTSTARDAADLISEAGLGHVHKYNGTQTSMIGIRGLSSDSFDETKSRVLVLVNGNRPGTVNLAKIPTDDIERIEIVKGPSSVLYGTSAMGGVVNIITKQGKGNFHGSVGAEGGSWDYWKTMVELGGIKSGFDYYLSGSLSGNGNYQTPDEGTLKNTGAKYESVSTRLGYTFLNNQHVSLGLQHWKGRDIGSPGPTYNSDPDDYTDKSRDGFDLEYKTDTLNAKYYLTYNRDDSYTTDGGMTSGPGNSVRFASASRNQGASIQNVFPIGDQRIIVGGQWDRIAVDTSTSGGVPYYPDSRFDNLALFTEGRVSLLDKKLLLNIGVRYDHFDNEIISTPGITMTAQTQSLDHVTTRGGIVYKLIDSLSLKGSIGTAFRAPAPLELAADYNTAWGRTIGNPGLKPEKSITYEAGFEYAKDLFKGGFAFFHTEFDDKIVTTTTIPGTSSYKNMGGATLQGVEINAAYDAGLAAGLSFSVEPYANVTYMTKHDSSEGTTLSYSPDWTGSFGIKAGQENWDTRLSVDYSGKERATDYDATSPTAYTIIDKGGFSVVNLKGTYKPIKNLELSLSVGNLLDREYAYILGYPMPGRTFTGGAKWLF